MAKSKWEDLLPASSAGSASRSDLLGQLAASTGGGSGGAGGSIGGSLTQSGNSDVTEQLTSLTTQITSLTSIQQSQTSALQDNTQAVTQNTSSKASSGSSVGSTVESAASSFLGGGLSSLSPLIGGLLSLFGGGGGQTLAAPSPFMLPAPVQSEAGVTASAPGQPAPVSYSDTGQPRAQSAGASAQVTIQVNAMDSQSFLDHSDDIANAVKQAILNSNSLNDVISAL
jgi:cell division septum initiation protein DivIVA